MGGMARLRRVAASSWAGVSCVRVGWAGMLFSARMGGIGPLSVVAEFYWWDSNPTDCPNWGRPDQTGSPWGAALLCMAEPLRVGKDRSSRSRLGSYY